MTWGPAVSRTIRGGFQGVFNFRCFVVYLTVLLIVRGVVQVLVVVRGVRRRNRPRLLLPHGQNCRHHLIAMALSALPSDLAER